MKDRNVEFPNRYQLVKVAGTDDVYDLIPTPGTVSDEGDYLNKNTLLKDVTAALYGLGTDAVPDEVLAKLWKSAAYCWRRRTPATTSKVLKLEPISSSVKAYNGAEASRTIQYSSSVVVNQETGEYSLSNPQEISISRGESGAMTLKNLAPCYVKNIWEYENRTYFLPEGTTSGGSDSFSIMYDSSGSISFSNAASSNIRVKVAAGTKEITTEATPWELIFDADRNTHPDSGLADGYEWEYLGFPLELAATAARVVTGTYVGTGTYGQYNPTSLTLPFAPKLLLISQRRQDSSGDFYASNWLTVATPIPEIGGLMFSIGYDNTMAATMSGTTLSWYSTASAQYQLNEAPGSAGYYYYYIAIG